jgi:hypothetical protein
MPQQAYKVPRVPRAMAPARTNIARSGSQASHSRSRSGNAHTSGSHAQSHAKAALAAGTTGTTKPGTTGTSSTHPGITTPGNTGPGTGRRGTLASATTGSGTNGHVNHGATSVAGGTSAGTSSSTTSALTGASHARATSAFPNSYTYGTGAGARHYRAYGYGSGYRNRYRGGRYGYGRSQGNNLAVIGRLRAVHAQLARIDHDYQGHRVLAMHAVSMAIRQLSHRSMVYSGVGFAPGINSRGLGMGQGGIGGGAGTRGAGRMPQAQSDARMSQSLRTLQGVNMQLSSQGSNTTGHSRARGHVMRAIRELNIALSVR